MKKVLAMSILTMIVMSMGGCGASSDSSSSQDVSSPRKDPFQLECFESFKAHKNSS